MDEEKIWQKEWFKIPFKELNIRLSLNRLPDQKFYDSFYDLLFKKYLSWNNLPKEWIREKELLALEIIKLIPFKAKVLSFGTGLGFVEDKILALRDDIQLSCFDTSKKSSKWFLKRHKNIPFYTDIEKLEKFDFIFFSQVLYSMPKDTVDDVFLKITKYIKHDGKCLLIDTPISKKNFLKNLIFRVKNKLKIIFFSITKKNQYQFWGWLRDYKIVKSILEKKNFNLVNIFEKDNQQYQLYTKIN